MNSARRNKIKQLLGQILDIVEKEETRQKVRGPYNSKEHMEKMRKIRIAKRDERLAQDPKQQEIADLRKRLADLEKK